jgi:predicted GNAT family acetyltransferase
MEIKRGSGKIYLELGGGEEAFVSFKEDENSKLLIVTTTFVPESHRGKGIAAKLTKELLKLADEKGYKIYPLCSYTRKYLERKRPELISDGTG